MQSISFLCFLWNLFMTARGDGPYDRTFRGGFIRPGDRIGVIASGEVDLSVIIEGLRTAGGRAVFFPGVQEALELGITFFDTAEAYGGGIENQGRATLIDSTLLGNTADTGGGITDSNPPFQ